MHTIRRCLPHERAAILGIINAAAEAYRGSFPRIAGTIPTCRRRRSIKRSRRASSSGDMSSWGSARRHGYAVRARCGFDPSCLREARQPAAGSWRCVDRASTRIERATDAGRYLERGGVGHPVLRAARIRDGVSAARRRAAQGLLGHFGAADRNIGGSGATAHSIGSGAFGHVHRGDPPRVQCAAWGRAGNPAECPDCQPSRIPAPGSHRSASDRATTIPSGESPRGLRGYNPPLMPAGGPEKKAC